MKRLYFILIFLLFSTSVFSEEYIIQTNDYFDDFLTDFTINSEIQISEICPVDTNVCKIVYYTENILSKGEQYIYITLYLKKGDLIYIREKEYSDSNISYKEYTLKIKNFSYNEIITDIIKNNWKLKLLELVNYFRV